MLTHISDLSNLSDPAAFARQHLNFQPDPHQTRVLQSLHPRLLLNCSRQWGKSTTAATLALHRALHHPASLILCVSPTERQSQELIRKIQHFLTLLALPTRPDKVNRLGFVLPNESRILGLPGSEAGLRGFSAPSLVILDEAARVSDALYKSLRPLLAVSQGDLHLLSTPFGQRGFFYREWTQPHNEWLKVEVPATQNPCIPPEFLAQELQSLGSDWFAQEYLCSFIGTENQPFRQEWLNAAKQEGLSHKRLEL
jgi:hypothetical protein